MADSLPSRGGSQSDPRTITFRRSDSDAGENPGPRAISPNASRHRTSVGDEPLITGGFDLNAYANSRLSAIASGDLHGGMGAPVEDDSPFVLGNPFPKATTLGSGTTKGRNLREHLIGSPIEQRKQALHDEGSSCRSCSRTELESQPSLNFGDSGHAVAVTFNEPLRGKIGWDPMRARSNAYDFELASGVSKEDVWRKGELRRGVFLDGKTASSAEELERRPAFTGEEEFDCSKSYPLEWLWRGKFPIAREDICVIVHGWQDPNRIQNKGLRYQVLGGSECDEALAALNCLNEFMARYGKDSEVVDPSDPAAGIGMGPPGGPPNSSLDEIASQLDFYTKTLMQQMFFAGSSGLSGEEMDALRDAWEEAYRNLVCIRSAASVFKKYCQADGLAGEKLDTSGGILEAIEDLFADFKLQSTDKLYKFASKMHKTVVEGDLDIGFAKFGHDLLAADLGRRKLCPLKDCPQTVRFDGDDLLLSHVKLGEEDTRKSNYLNYYNCPIYVFHWTVEVIGTFAGRVYFTVECGAPYSEEED